MAITASTEPVVKVRAESRKKTDDAEPPRARVFRDWTPPMLRAAEIAAESGNLSMAATICEWLLSDDAVSGALGARIDALLGLDISFDGGDESVHSDLERDAPRMYPEDELTQILEYGLLLGVAPARHAVRIDDETKRALPSPEFWVPQTLTQDTLSGQWRITDSQGAVRDVNPGDGEWVLHTPYGARRPWARGLWRSLCRWALLKQYAMRDWARHSEIGARLFAKTLLDKDGLPLGTDGQRAQLVQEIKDAGGEFVAALPAGWDVSLLELTANTRDIYLAQIEAANNAIRIRIRGGDLSSNAGGGGSYAAAESQAATNEAPKRRFDGQSLASTLRDQSTVYWAEYNYGAQNKAPYIRWQPPASEKEVDYASIASALSALSGLGAQFDLEVLQNQFGLNFVTEIDPSKARSSQPGFGGFASVNTSPRALGEQYLARARALDQSQGFVDKLGEAAAEQALLESSTLTEALMQAVNQATSAAELDTMLKSTLKGFDAETLQAVTEKARVLAELAGRFAVVDEL